MHIKITIPFPLNPWRKDQKKEKRSKEREKQEISSKVQRKDR